MKILRYLYANIISIILFPRHLTCDVMHLKISTHIYAKPLVLEVYPNHWGDLQIHCPSIRVATCKCTKSVL